MFEMKIKRSKAEQAFNIFNIILMFVLMVVTLYPLLYVLFASLSDASKLMQHSGLLFKPLGLNLSSYKIVIQDRQILSGYMNTIIVVVAGVLISMVLTILGAYTLSRKNLYWGKMISMIVIIPMFFSGGLIPFYLLVKNLGMLDSLWALILPTALSTYNMMIMRTALAGVPKALEEAAEIDGANGLKRFFHITLPMLSPTMFMVTILSLISSFQVFDLISIMTEGGPGRATNVLVYRIYQEGFKYLNFGYASAMAYFLFLIILIITLIQFRGQKKWVTYMQ